MSEESFYRGVFGGEARWAWKASFLLRQHRAEELFIVILYSEISFYLKEVDEVLLIISVHKGHRIDYCD